MRYKIQLTKVAQWLELYLDPIAATLQLATVGWLLYSLSAHLNKAQTFQLGLLAILAMFGGIMLVRWVYRKRHDALLQDQISRESEMLDRFRQTVLDLHKGGDGAK